MALRVKPAIVRPELATYFDQHLRLNKRVNRITALRKPRRQKKHRRAVMGWLRPKRCPHCRQYTRQIPAKRYAAGGLHWRVCLSCKREFVGQHSERVAA